MEGLDLQKVGVEQDQPSSLGRTGAFPETLEYPAGRRPYVEGLDLQKVGVELDRRGRIQVDEHFKSTAPSGNIFAIGDVIDGPMLAHKVRSRVPLPGLVLVHACASP